MTILKFKELYQNLNNLNSNQRFFYTFLLENIDTIISEFESIGFKFIKIKLSPKSDSAYLVFKKYFKHWKVRVSDHKCNNYAIEVIDDIIHSVNEPYDLDFFAARLEWYDLLTVIKEINKEDEKERILQIERKQQYLLDKKMGEIKDLAHELRSSYGLNFWYSRGIIGCQMSHQI